MEAQLSEAKIKEILKAALVEAIEERRDLIGDLIEEALEDVALARAIDKGKGSKVVGRDEVFKILEGKE